MYVLIAGDVTARCYRCVCVAEQGVAAVTPAQQRGTLRGREEDRRAQPASIHQRRSLLSKVAPLLMYDWTAGWLNAQTHTYPDDTHSHGAVKSCKLPPEEALCISAGSRVTKDTRARSLLPSYTLTGTPTCAPKKSSRSHLALPRWNPFSAHRATAYTLPVRPARVSQHICQRGPFRSSHNGAPTDESDPFWDETDIKSGSDRTSSLSGSDAG